MQVRFNGTVVIQRPYGNQGHQTQFLERMHEIFGDHNLNVLDSRNPEGNIVTEKHFAHYFPSYAPYREASIIVDLIARKIPFSWFAQDANTKTLDNEVATTQFPQFHPHSNKLLQASDILDSMAKGEPVSWPPTPEKANKPGKVLSKVA